jgi:hypothetical protein
MVFHSTVNGSSLWSTEITTEPPLPSTTTLPHEDLPDVGESENEKQYSMTIFFILLVIGQFL